MATLPASHTFTGGTATSSEMNSYARDPLNFLLTPPHFQLIQIVSQSPASATSTAITFTSEVVDTDIDATGGHDNATNNTRWTARYPGWYLLGGGVAFNANATGIRYAWIRVNGADASGSLGQMTPTVSDVNVVSTRPNFQAYLNAGDYVELFVSQTSGAPLATYVATALWQTTLSGLWVSS